LIYFFFLVSAKQVLFIQSSIVDHGFNVLW